MRRAPRRGAVPVTLVTGFLGSGKTTFVRALLERDDGTRVAVVVNEFGELGIDAALVRGSGTPVVELANGCICCVNRGNMAAALAELARRADRIDAIVVETSGVADPLGVADLIATTVFPADLVLGAVVTVVDAENFDRNLRHADVAYQQLVAADLFVVGKSDLVPAAVVPELRRRLRTLNPAPSVVSEHGRIADDVLAELPARTTGPADGWHRKDHTWEFTSVSWTSGRPLRLGAFVAWVDALPASVCRIKAVVRHEDEWYAVHRVHRRTTVLQVSPHTGAALGCDRARVVLIGRELDALGLRDALDELRSSTPGTAGVP